MIDAPRHMPRYAFIKDDIPELKCIGKTMVVIVETKDGSTSGEVLDAASFKNGSEEMRLFINKWLT